MRGRPVRSLHEGVSGRREWVQIRSSRSGDGVGWIPRDVLESLGTDCSALDRRDSQGKQGTVWITREVSEAIRRHPHWEPTVDA